MVIKTLYQHIKQHPQRAFRMRDHVQGLKESPLSTRRGGGGNPQQI